MILQVPIKNYMKYKNKYFFKIILILIALITIILTGLFVHSTEPKQAKYQPDTGRYENQIVTNVADTFQDIDSITFKNYKISAMNPSLIEVTIAINDEQTPERLLTYSIVPYDEQPHLTKYQQLPTNKGKSNRDRIKVQNTFE
ncbi:hypothetical protein SAMN05216341_101265 [Leuconostocaceae bacterium R-53105]|uniref:Uncharacterized protein n=2 Tax=Convivina intestini TaxID=1505726 RepID=A0A2U1DFA7_9LACO|nr:hypothetical protein C7384_101273 [Convivina intestini]CAH1850688.1 hypothetical protein R077811_00141 [Convivina intestini]CAH1852646.1 hypothetical protein R078131_00524 [Convivina intestini]SDB82860.1 hypothetical protein SAMN05216341_101265 [Leuconostocaceae bacterium R-53105]